MLRFSKSRWGQLRAFANDRYEGIPSSYSVYPFNHATYPKTMSTLAESLDGLHSEDPNADLTELLDTILSEISPSEGNSLSIEAAFRVFERHPLCYFGSPGPLVHWLERSYPKYVDSLVSSMERRPTEHTLWMANRILNANIEATTRASLIAALKTAAIRTDIEQPTVTAAIEWLDLHN